MLLLLLLLFGFHKVTILPSSLLCLRRERGENKANLPQNTSRLALNWFRSTETVWVLFVLFCFVGFCVPQFFQLEPMLPSQVTEPHFSLRTSEHPPGFYLFHRYLRHSPCRPARTHGIHAPIEAINVIDTH